MARFNAALGTRRHLRQILKRESKRVRDKNSEVFSLRRLFSKFSDNYENLDVARPQPPI